MEFVRKIVKEEINKVLIAFPTEEKGIYFDFSDDNFSINLNEGLYKTYPPNTTVKYVKKLFNLTDDMIGILDTNGSTPEEKRIWSVYCDLYENSKRMEKAMLCCGYTLSKEERDDNIIQQIYIPINPPNINDIVRKYDHITHITPIYYKEKILKRGFVPKSTNVMFSYPERVFFFKGDTPPIEMSYQIIDFDEKRKNKRNNHTYTLFTVDTKKIPENVNFHTDLTYPFGIYTNDNIPPSAIRHTQDFDCTQLFKA